MSTRKNITEKVETADLQNVILYNSFLFSMVNDGKDLNNLEVYTDSKNKFFLFDSIRTSTLMICIPPSEDICSSCIDYAVNSVKDFFPDFSSNGNIIIFSHTIDSRIKNRIHEKKIYRCFSDDCILGLTNNIENKPFYIITDTDRKANMFFVPNSLMPELTSRYLKIVSDRYFK
ncbi:MAG: hypothetical protein LBQ60_04950 [Bacteroidales bacterium]|nr:hypothetical protein [Bacteroidales bacterium]